MDQYSKYGLLAAGAIGLYIVAKKQGLSDDVRDDSYEELSKNDASLSGIRKRRSLDKGSSTQHGRYIDLIRSSKSLTIKLTSEGKEEADDLGESPSYREIDKVWYDWWDDIRGNSSYIYVDDASEIGGLSSTPLILHEASYDDEARIEIDSNTDIFYDPDYQIRDFRQVLIEKGQVTLPRLADGVGDRVRKTRSTSKRKASKKKTQKKKSLRDSGITPRKVTVHSESDVQSGNVPEWLWEKLTYGWEDSYDEEERSDMSPEELDDAKAEYAIRGLFEGNPDEIKIGDEYNKQESRSGLFVIFENGTDAAVVYISLRYSGEADPEMAYLLKQFASKNYLSYWQRVDFASWKDYYNLDVAIAYRGGEGMFYAVYKYIGDKSGDDK